MNRFQDTNPLDWVSPQRLGQILGIRNLQTVNCLCGCKLIVPEIDRKLVEFLEPLPDLSDDIGALFQLLMNGELDRLDTLCRQWAVLLRYRFVAAITDGALFEQILDWSGDPALLSHMHKIGPIEIDGLEAAPGLSVEDLDSTKQNVLGLLLGLMPSPCLQRMRLRGLVEEDAGTIPFRGSTPQKEQFVRLSTRLLADPAQERQGDATD